MINYHVLFCFFVFIGKVSNLVSRLLPMIKRKPKSLKAAYMQLVNTHSQWYLTLALMPTMSWTRWSGLRSSGTISVTKLIKSTSLSYCITLCCCIVCHMKAEMSLTGGTRRCKELRGRGTPANSNRNISVLQKRDWMDTFVILQRLKQTFNVTHELSATVVMTRQRFS